MQTRIDQLLSKAGEFDELRKKVESLRFQVEILEGEGAAESANRIWREIDRNNTLFINHHMELAAECVDRLISLKVNT